MRIETAINKRGDAKIAILHQGVDTNICALGIIEDMKMFNFDIDLVRMAASVIDEYGVYNARKGRIYRRVLKKFGAEVSRHYNLREHIVYDVPDDLFYVVDMFGVNYTEPELRNRVYKVIDEASSWEQFKDRLLAMKAAEVL